MSGWGFIALGCLLAFAAFGDGQQSKPFFAKPLLLGVHRGGEDLWPENTIEAYRNAAARWPDALLEGDAEATSDGQVVLLHDSTVDRTTNGSGRLAQMTTAEIKALDAGYRFTPDDGQTFPYRGKGIAIPLLTEALAAAPSSRFLIELKDQPGLADLTVRALQQAQALDRVIVASFNPALIERACKLEPRLLRCYDLIDGFELLARLRGQYWQAYRPVADMLAIDQRFIRAFQVQPAELCAIRDKGIAVLVHTIDKPEAMRAFLEMGVSSILTDRPDELARVLAERSVTAAASEVPAPGGSPATPVPPATATR